MLRDFLDIALVVGDRFVKKRPLAGEVRPEMSERLNSVDIEDVLSSIRRLVSDDARPAVKAAVPPPVPEPQADKLILTPALRIAPEPEPEPQPVPERVGQADADSLAAQASQPDPVDVQEEGETSPVMSFHSVRPERGAARLDAVMGQVAQGLDAGPDDWETAAEPPSHFESDWAAAEEDLVADMTGKGGDTNLDAQDIADDPADASAVWSVATADAPFVGMETGFDIAAAAQAGRELAADVTVPADILLGAGDGDSVIRGAFQLDDAELRPDGIARDPDDAWPEQDWAAPGEPDHDALSAADADVVDAAPMTIDIEPVALAEEPAMTDKDDPADLPDWARMEAEPVDPAPSEPPATPHPRAGEDFRWADAAEAEIRRELEDTVEPQVFAHFAEEDDLDARAFDEDMLRDLVRDIIREELQGALGERITRNVRKLVRAEIARALAVRDFE